MPQLPINFDFIDTITVNRELDYLKVHSAYSADVTERNYNHLLSDVYINCGRFLQSNRNVLPHYNSYVIYSPSDFIYLYGYNYFTKNYTLNKNVLESRIASHIQRTGVPFVHFYNKDYGYTIDYTDFIQYHQRTPEIYKLNHTFTEEDIPIVAYESLFGGITLIIDDNNFVFRKTHTQDA